jgi:hypothetical protein
MGVDEARQYREPAPRHPFEARIGPLQSRALTDLGNPVAGDGDRAAVDDPPIGVAGDDRRICDEQVHEIDSSVRSLARGFPSALDYRPRAAMACGLLLWQMSFALQGGSDFRFLRQMQDAKRSGRLAQLCAGAEHEWESERWIAGRF